MKYGIRFKVDNEERYIGVQVPDDLITRIEEFNRYLKHDGKWTRKGTSGSLRFAENFPLFSNKPVTDLGKHLGLRVFSLQKISLALAPLSYLRFSRLLELEAICCPVRTVWDLLILPRDLFVFALEGYKPYSSDVSGTLHTSLRRLVSASFRWAAYLRNRRLTDCFKILLKSGFQNKEKWLQDLLATGRLEPRRRKRRLSFLIRFKHMVEFTDLREWDLWRAPSEFTQLEREALERAIADYRNVKRPYFLGLPCVSYIGPKAFLFDHSEVKR